MTERLRILERDGKFYPQFRGWFGWACFDDRGGNLFCLTLDEARAWLANYRRGPAPDVIHAP
jgi:hypothetical protein